MRVNTPAEVNPDKYDIYVDEYTKEWNQHLIARILEEVRDRNMNVIKLLDVGTGTARTLIELARITDLQSIELHGVDYYQDMVDKAIHNVMQLGLAEKIKIKQGDVHKLPYDSNSMDIIIGRSVIHHWAEPVAAYKEIYRVLREGGLAIIHEPSKDPTPEALAEFNKKRHECGIHGANLEEKFSKADVENQLKEAGLSEKAKVIRGEGIYGIGFELLIFK